jgi:ketosteroid isomerase-like protein
MSLQDVEALRAVYERWGRGDFWTPEIFDHDVEVVWSPEILDISVARGLAAVEESIRDWLSAWENLRMEAERLIDLGEDRILVLVAAYGRGKGSGVEVVGGEYAHLWTMRGGEAIRLVGYTDRGQARQDAGLLEPT